VLRRRTVLLGFWLAGVVLALMLLPQAARAVPAACGSTVERIQTQVQALASSTRGPDLQTKVAGVFSAARRDHPECKAEIDQVARSLRSAASQRATGQHAEPFLGPIGWLWNNIYYRVFQGNNVMMAVFGWELFLSPVILVLAGAAVLRGVGAALHPPEVPDSIRAV
jgi:hypothetical protein